MAGGVGGCHGVVVEVGEGVGGLFCLITFTWADGHNDVAGESDVFLGEGAVSIFDEIWCIAAAGEAVVISIGGCPGPVGKKYYKMFLNFRGLTFYP